MDEATRLRGMLFVQRQCLENYYDCLVIAARAARLAAPPRLPNRLEIEGQADNLIRLAEAVLDGWCFQTHLGPGGYNVCDYCQAKNPVADGPELIGHDPDCVVLIARKVSGK